MAMANDKEYVQAQIDAAGNTAELSGGKASPPPLTEWSMVAEKLAENTEEVRALKIAFISANSKKGAKRPEWKPVLRPVGVLVELLRKRRYENHYKLRARLLPKLYGKPSAQPTAEQSPKEDTQWDTRASFVRRR